MSDIEAILAGTRDMYDAFLAGDRARFDAHLDAGTTTWESHLPRLFARADLDRFRDERGPSTGPAIVGLEVQPQRVEVWDDTALAAYLLLVRFDGAPAEVTRVTDLLRLGPDGWRIVHHHAQVHDDAAADGTR